MVKQLWYNFWNNMTISAFRTRRFQLQYENEEWSFAEKAGKPLPFWLVYGSPEMVKQSMRAMLALQKAKVVSFRTEEDRRLQAVWEERKPESIKCNLAFTNDDKTSLTIKISDSVPRSFEEAWSGTFIDFLEEYSKEYDAEFKIESSTLDLLNVYPGLAADATLHSMAKEVLLVNIEGEPFFINEFIEEITEKGIVVDGLEVIFRF